MPSWLKQSHGCGLRVPWLRRSSKSRDRDTALDIHELAHHERDREQQDHQNAREIPEMTNALTSKYEGELAAPSEVVKSKDNVEVELSGRIKQLELDLVDQTSKRHEGDLEAAKRSKVQEKLRQDLEDELSETHNVRSDLLRRNAALDTVVREYGSRIDELEGENGQQQRELETLQETIAAQVLELDQVKYEAHELSSQVISVHAEKKEASLIAMKERELLQASAKQEMEELRISYRNDKVKLEQELDDTKEFVRELEGNLRTIKDSYKTTKKEKEMLKCEIKGLEESHARTIKSLSDAATQQLEEEMKKFEALMPGLPPTPPTPQPGVLTAPIPWALDYDLNNVYSRQFYCVATANHGGRCGCNFRFVSHRLAEATAIVSKMRSTDPGETFERASLHDLAFRLMCSDIHASNESAVREKANKWYDMLAPARAQLRKARDARNASLGAPPLFGY